MARKSGDRSVHECALDHVVARRAVLAFDEAGLLQQVGRVLQHRGAAAQHHAVVFRRERRDVEIREQLARRDQVGDPAFVVERFARDRRVVDELFLDDVAEVLVARQVVLDVVHVRELALQAARASGSPCRSVRRCPDRG